MSWIHHDNGFHLLCNRDEKRTRKPALPPRLQCPRGVRFVAPVDGDFGGSWMSANEAGVALCLLNGANLGGCARHRSTTGTRSRGLLLLELADAPSTMGACERLARLDLDQWAPFTLAGLEPGLPACLVEWNGVDLVILPNGDPFMPLISSSFETEAVRQRRRAEFAHCTRQGLNAEALCGFHGSHGGEASAFSTCMHRPDAETVSFSWVQVDEHAVSFFYSPTAPCQGRSGETTRLELLS
ncbi:NRDE family protein [uncultured Paludibaculum sp.]|uniref:NRDE family protein n=1 Tax=uncultured Paludibaculum sp. TaxID=1765020 RepID=UPI002AAB3AC0|nr:NRDE family protein [uncultured Paludibaculum sp.]